MKNPSMLYKHCFFSHKIDNEHLIRNELLNSSQKFSPWTTNLNFNSNFSKKLSDPSFFGKAVSVLIDNKIMPWTWAIHYAYNMGRWLT